jgi:hypothetical protein
LVKLYNLFAKNFIDLNPQLKKYYIFLGASLVFSIGLQIVLGYLGVPWFISIGLVMAIFILLPMYMRRRQMGQMGNFGGSSSGSGGGFFGTGSQDNSTKVQYVCLVCNNKHKGGSCPRCGSKMQRADF